MRPAPISEAVRFEATGGSVSGLLLRPPGSRWLLLLAHGAGAGMRHPFMQRVADALGARGVATLRYQFPYMEAGRRRPDHGSKLIATVRAAAAEARRRAPELPLFAGGKSMGGRMTSMAAAEQPLGGVAGLIFFGFPLHPAGRPSRARGEHLAAVGVPMLFLQGTRDPLADLGLLEPVCRELGRRAELHAIEGGDHSFKVLKRSGRGEDEVMAELAEATRAFCEAIAGR
jgi:predicted alpha/beta-hydrolase family hydrolase